MRRFIAGLAIIALFAACGGGGGNPESVVKGMFDAMKAGDGEKVVSYLCAEAITEIEEQLEYPEDIAMSLSFMGIEKTEDEIASLTPGEYMDLILGSEMMQMVWDMAELEIGDAVIDGETAVVEITIKMEFMGESTEETDEVELIMEDGAWKISSEFGMGF